MKLSRDEVLQIAAAQKLLLWIILAAIAINVGALGIQNVLAAQQAVDPRFAAGIGLGILLISLLLVVLQIFGVVRLCLALKEGWATAIYAILQLAPCLSLILLLFLNGRATSRLKDCGIRVGLMGANSQDLANYRQQTTRACPNCGEALEADTRDCPMCGAEATVS